MYDPLDTLGTQAVVVPATYQASDYATGGYESCEVARPLTTSADRSRSAPLVAGNVGCLAPDVTPKGRDDGLSYCLMESQSGKMAVCVTVPVTHTLTHEGADASEDGTGRGTPIVAFAENVRGELRETEVAQSLNTNGGKPGQGYPAVRIGGIVRRLTPRECERLMGWPDDWTRWRADGSEIADGPRYRLCGNGVVGTVSGWLARRMMAVMTGGEA